MLKLQHMNMCITLSDKIYEMRKLHVVVVVPIIKQRLEKVGEWVSSVYKGAIAYG